MVGRPYYDYYILWLDGLWRFVVLFPPMDFSPRIIWLLTLILLFGTALWEQQPPWLVTWLAH